MGLARRAEPPCTLFAHRDRDDCRPQRQPGSRRVVGRVIGVDPAQVLIADLDDVAAFHEMLDALTRRFPVGDQRGPHVGVQRDRRRHPIRVEQGRDRPASRFAHGRDGPGVHEQRRGNLGCAGELPVQIETVGGRPFLGDRCRGGRCASGGHTSRNKLCVRGFDVFGDSVPARVVGDVAQEVDVAAQPGESDGDVERTTTDVFVGPDDVDQ